MGEVKKETKGDLPLLLEKPSPKPPPLTQMHSPLEDIIKIVDAKMREILTFHLKSMSFCQPQLKSPLWGAPNQPSYF